MVDPVCLVGRDTAKGGAAARLQLQSVVPVTCPTPHAQSQRGLLEWDRRPKTWGLRGALRGGRRQLLATPCVLRVVSTTHTSMTSEATTSNVMTSERGRGHTCARLSIIYARAYTVSVCAPLKKEDVFATFFFFVITFSVNRRGFIGFLLFSVEYLITKLGYVKLGTEEALKIL